MKLIKKFVYLPLCSLLISSIFSCATTDDSKKVVYEVPNFTQEDARKNEIERIEELLPKEDSENIKTDSVFALWRSWKLGDEVTKEKCFVAVVKEFDNAIEKANWFLAKKIYKALKVVGYPRLDSLQKSESELEALCRDSISGLSDSKKSAEKVSSLINGTVTILVDKGIAVHNGRGYADRVIGSGFFISKDGYIITNHHVISDMVDPKNKKYSRLFIKLAEDSDTRIPAKVVGWDSLLDLALLKTEVDAPFVFNLGSSEDLDVGDKVYAIGSPVGLERTLTSGIVSAVDRKLFSIASVMQIDAAVNSGNSGGPCVDSNGNVQAIVFAGMLMYEGLNFAIPVEYLKSELASLYYEGEIKHSWIGCFGRTKKVLGSDSGLEVQYVMPGGSANRCGIKVGDVIVEADGQKVTTLDDFQNILIKNTAKSIIEIKYISDIDSETPTEHTSPIYLANRPKQPGNLVYDSDIISNSFLPIFGMKLIKITEGFSKKYTIENIIRGSIADETGFSETDPVTIQTIKFDNDKSVIYVDLYAKSRRKGYLEVAMSLAAPLDNPYFF